MLPKYSKLFVQSLRRELTEVISDRYTIINLYINNTIESHFNQKKIYSITKDTYRNKWIRGIQKKYKMRPCH